MKDYKNEIEFKLTFKSDDSDVWDNLNKFRDIFMYVFNREINSEQVLAVVKIIKDNGKVLNKGKQEEEDEKVRDR